METSEAVHEHQAQRPQASARNGGDFEKLFQMLEELGPAPELFMVNTCDPVLERDYLFDAEDFE